MQPEGPYLLGGRCFGGRVVFEMAQQLRKSGQRTALLAIFDTWPPFETQAPTQTPQKKDIKHFVIRSIHHLKTGALATVAKNYSLNKIFKAKRTIKNKLEYIFSDSKNKLYKKIMQMHFKAQDTYIASKYSGKITLIECGTFKDANRDRWRNLALDGLESYSVPGSDHETIMTEPYIKLFAEKLNFILDKANKEVESTNGKAKFYPRITYKEIGQT